MRRLLALPLLMIVVLFGVWLIRFPQEVRGVFEQFFQKEPFITLEKRFSPHEIMAHHQEELLRLPGSSYQEPTTIYYPFLLLNVSHEKGRKSTQEGTVLVNLQNGSLILNPLTWEIAEDSTKEWPPSEPLIAWLYEGGTKASIHLSEEKATAQAKEKGLQIHHSRLVYLPVYHIDIQNPDDSIRETRWNAFSGTPF